MILQCGNDTVILRCVLFDSGIGKKDLVLDSRANPSILSERGICIYIGESSFRSTGMTDNRNPLLVTEIHHTPPRFEEMAGTHRGSDLLADTQ